MFPPPRVSTPGHHSDEGGGGQGQAGQHVHLHGSQVSPPPQRTASTRLTLLPLVGHPSVRRRRANAREKVFPHSHGRAESQACISAAGGADESLDEHPACDGRQEPSSSALPTPRHRSLLLSATVCFI